MREGTPNPQINVSKITGGAGIAGALFAVGSMLIFLVGIPRLRYFFPAAVVLGCAVAVILRLVRRETPGQPWINKALTASTVVPRAEGDSPDDFRPGLQSRILAAG